MDKERRRMELEQEVRQAEQCKEILNLLTKWKADRKDFLVNLLCNIKETDHILAIRGELKGLEDFFNSLNSKIDNAKVAKSLLKELK